jgi:hypothetical protein
MSRRQNAGQKAYGMIANTSFKHVANIKYLGTTGTNQNYIHKEITSRLNSQNTC